MWPRLAPAALLTTCPTHQQQTNEIPSTLLSAQAPNAHNMLAASEHAAALASQQAALQDSTL
eukprot:CAMPEP_0202883104 /NCGR_PEP_ID=MMETSP1391-20130828/38965_1 /ASSEMBLY_ACC=CAM_ASM_000867 /TAXON_ID=1034604 /ORGANISM="Chlamydomonas leiostraca, Strain SAG 11-49" /LENGTH=61 /DNA_ID=CAMNT_0049566069 /DNA_START=334 /DNA_END=520 /DNA_ORIENTATION=+